MLLVQVTGLVYIKGTAKSWHRLYTGPYWDILLCNSIQAQKRTAYPSCGASSEENKAQRSKATGLREHREQGHRAPLSCVMISVASLRLAAKPQDSSLWASLLPKLSLGLMRTGISSSSGLKA